MLKSRQHNRLSRKWASAIVPCRRWFECETIWAEHRRLKYGNEVGFLAIFRMVNCVFFSTRHIKQNADFLFTWWRKKGRSVSIKDSNLSDMSWLIFCSPFFCSSSLSSDSFKSYWLVALLLLTHKMQRTDEWKREIDRKEEKNNHNVNLTSKIETRFMP